MIINLLTLFAVMDKTDTRVLVIRVCKRCAVLGVAGLYCSGEHSPGRLQGPLPVTAQVFLPVAGVLQGDFLTPPLCTVCTQENCAI